MWKCLLLGWACLAPAVQAAGASLTDVETRWLGAGAPVLAFARAQGLPLDVIVQPRARPGDVPLAMAFVAGRCKLVLSMRERPDAEEVLEGVPAELADTVIEAVVAHELAHCWRHVGGHWGELPAGFVDAEPAEPAAPRRQMRETRREEGLADLVALAWTQARHPAEYPRVHAWLSRVRADQPVPGAHHDTRAWLRLADRGEAFAGAHDTPFAAAWPLWLRALHTDE